MSLTTTPDQLQASFPFPFITKTTERPTYTTIRSIHKKLAANASSVRTVLGGGQHGYLAIVIDPPVYQTLTGHAFIPPANPGLAPVIPAGARPDQIAQLRDQHKTSLTIWEQYNNMQTALKNQIVGVFDEIHLKQLQHDLTGFANVTAWDLINHLYNSYGTQSPDDITQNEARMKADWNVTRPFEHLVEQIEDAVQFAANANVPFTDAQITNTGLHLVQKTGVFREECKTWRRRPANQQTWANFKTFFNEAYRDYQIENNITAANTEYGANNISEDNNPDDSNTAEALEHLAAATATDREAVANLTTANQRLTQELQNRGNSIEALQTAVDQLSQRIQTLSTQPQQQPVPTYWNHPLPFAPTWQPPRPNKGGRGKGGRRGKGSNQKGQQNPQIHYCWTHGVTFTNSHTSANCRNRAQGHQETATLENRMGGSTTGLGM